MAELRECPFCGANKWSVPDRHGIYTLRHEKGCWLGYKERIKHGDKETYLSQIEEIKAWNTRPAPEGKEPEGR